MICGSDGLDMDEDDTILIEIPLTPRCTCGKVEL